MIANVDTAVVVMSLARPDPSLDLVDRILVMAEREKLDAIVVFNKVDLVQEAEAQRIERAIFPGRLPRVSHQRFSRGRDRKA